MIPRKTVKQALAERATKDDKYMVGKRVQFDDETWAIVNLLRQERRRSFQQLADEAFVDLLAKYGRQIDVENQLRASLGKDTVKKPRQRKKAKSDRD